MIYDATFDNAVGFVSAKTGNTNITPIVLEEAYKKLFYYIMRQKEFDSQTALDVLFEYIEQATDEFKAPDIECGDFSATENCVKAVEDEDIAMSEEQATEDLFVKKAHSYVLQRASLERRIFILYYYENFTAEKISKLFSIPIETVYGYIKKTSEDIQTNFLLKYMSR